MSDWDDATRLTTGNEVAKPKKKRDQAFLIVIAGNNVGEMYRIDDDGAVLGRGEDANIRLFDDGVSRNHAQVVLDGEYIVVQDLKSSNGTFCNGQRVMKRVLQDGDKIQVGRTTILKFTYHDDLDETFQQNLFDSALRDGLTKAFNKKYFMERLESEFRFMQRHKTSLSLYLFDLDHFKEINDTYGHLAGDQVLVAFSEAMQEGLRQEDVFARYGGEEFALVCRAISRDDSLLLGERLRATVENLGVVYDGTAVPVTVSIGLATCPEVMPANPIELIDLADKALYMAKNAGRNQIAVAK